MPRLVVRRASLADLEPLVSLERLFPTDAITRRNFRHLLKNANAAVWVCTENKHVLGNVVLLYRRRSSTARIYSLVVDRAARGRGIASRLLALVRQAATQAGCAYLSLEVRPNNRAAVRLYEKLGYQLTRRIEDFYEDGMAALRFELPLKAPASRRAARAPARRSRL